MRISITLNEQTGKDLEAAAAAEDRSISSFAARLIEREFIARQATRDVRAAAEAAAAVVGSERVLAGLADMKAEAYAAEEARG